HQSLHEPADRILVSEILSRYCLANDRNTWSAFIIGLCEYTSVEQRNLHGLEIGGTDLVICSPRSLAAACCRFSDNPECNRLASECLVEDYSLWQRTRRPAATRAARACLCRTRR